MTVPNVETEMYDLVGKDIHPCISCYKCLEKGKCTFTDDLQVFANKYMEADGVLCCAPVYHMSIPAQMKALFDRMGSIISVTSMRQGKDMPRFSKVCGVLTNGAHRYGGQEMTLNFMIHSSLLMNGVVVAGDSMAGSYIGVAAHTGHMPDVTAKDNVLKDEEGMRLAENIGKRVAEMATVVKTGLTALKSKLPGEYFDRWEIL